MSTMGSIARNKNGSRKSIGIRNYRRWEVANWLPADILAHLRSSTSFSNCQTDTKDGISTKVRLVGGAVELIQKFIDSRLVFNVDVLFNELRSDYRVDVVDGLGHTYCRPVSLGYKLGVTKKAAG